MTEQQWLDAPRAADLIDHPVCRDRRKLRLLAVACARRMLPALPNDPAFGGIVDAAERYADDPAARKAAVAARKPLRAAVKRLDSSDRSLKAATYILIDLTADALEGHTAGIHNALHLIEHSPNTATAGHAAERTLQADYLRDIFGNPFRPVALDPSWQTTAAIGLAQSMYDARDFAAMPILADALEDAGCDSADVLAHCRGDGSHVRGCWVVDLVLGKN